MGGSDPPIAVLHVDDDSDFVETVADFLERGDRMRVQGAASGSEALDRLDAEAVDCVVSDYEMPGMDGIALLERVRDDHPDLPFILFTGKGSEEVAGEAIAAGVTGYLQKGDGTEQYELLANRIENAVEARRSERRAERRRHRLEQILKTVPACVTQIDYDGRFVYANDRAEEVLGLEQADVTERTYNDPDWRITDLDGEPLPDEELPFRQVRDSGEPIYGYRHTVEWPDGTRRVLHVNGAPVFDEDGAVESAVFALTDVTERRERERELERYREIVETTDDIAFVVDEDRRLAYVNPTVEEYVDTPVEELVGTPLADLADTFFVDPDDTERFMAALERAFDADDPSAPPERLEHTLDMDVGERTFEYQLSPLVEDRTTTAVIGTMRDVTERVEREREVARERTRFQTLFEHLPSPVMRGEAVDGEPIVRQVNPAFEEVFGYDADEVEGENLDDLIVPEDQRDELHELNRRILEQGRVRTEVRRETVDGVRDFQLQVILNDDTDPPEGYAIYTDITDRKERERALERQNERLDGFVSLVGHDLRNPLLVAQGQLDFAREDCESEHLEAAGDAQRRMARMIDDLLVYAREGERVEDWGPVALEDRVERCWRNIATDDAALALDADLTIRANERRVERLLENLLANAVEHGGDDVTVTVSALDDGDGFAVADDGPGIPPEDRDDVFASGYSADPDGVGLGLAIVREIAAAHGWDVAVTASEQGGARFAVSGVEVLDDAGA